MDKKQIIKVSEKTYRIITPQAPLIEETTLEELENQIKRLETEKGDYKEKNKIIFDKVKEIDADIEKIKTKIEEIKKVKI